MLFPNLDVHYIGQSVYYRNGYSYASFRDFRLYSTFQPVFSLSHKRIVGYEALIRPKHSTGKEINPSQLFDSIQDNYSMILLDRLCRYLHVKNFLSLKDPINWLFLNVPTVVMIYGKQYGTFFADLLHRFNLPPHQVVIEIMEQPSLSPDLLLETIRFFKDTGCLIAIDDFGTGHSNFERIWNLSPDIVKLDRSMISRASTEYKIRQILPGIVSLLHQAGSLVLMEGIETEEQAMIAMDCDADFVQGFFFAPPSADVKNTFVDFDCLFETYKSVAAAQENRIEQICSRYRRLYLEAVNRLQNAMLLENACTDLLADDLVLRCYLLEPNGVQIGHTVVSSHSMSRDDIRFRPLREAQSADWFRRHYLRRAILHPNQMQISRPYLSITGAHLCVTLSMMFSTPAGNRVFCCDLNWGQEAP